MIRTHDITLNHETGLATLEDRSVEGIDRVQIEDVDVPYSIDVDGQFTRVTFPRRIGVKIVEDGDQTKIAVSDK